MTYKYRYVVRMIKLGRVIQVVSEKKFCSKKNATNFYNELITYQRPSEGLYADMRAL